jgi:sulfatase modifying factor 1
MMRTRLLVAALYVTTGIAACSATPPQPQDGPPPEVEPPAFAQTDGVPTATIEPVAPSPAPTSKPAEPSHCPSGMVLVEGDYCSKVKQTCLVQWYAPQNRKQVCEQFEQPTQCVGTKEKKRFCIDKYAYPNKKGARPEVMNQFYQMQVKCAAQGKRMCTETEWTFACEGPEMKPFPHGYVRDPDKCNGDHKWDNPKMTRVGKRDATELARLWRGVPSGSQPECVSDFGVADLPANNDEFVSGDSRKAKYNSVNTGGPWYSGVRNQCRPKVYTHEEGFYYYFLGFRCCGEPDGKEAELLTKKQIRDKWKVSQIERLAGFTIEQQKQVDALKAKGECNCGPRNSLPGVELRKSPSWLCKTMCGTLLGPGAKDGDASTRVPHRSRRKISE